MGLFKCKMCGGTIETEENKFVVTCDFCGVTQTIHGFDNEKKINLFKRANALRFKCEFDKASAIYETIVTDFPKEAEAYWGLLLCKYGIEYVDDPKTGEKIPTCHRTEFSSIIDDLDYKNVIKYSDVIARDVYAKEAFVIDKLQKDILAESNKANPFDVFICYKETSDGGSRTEDSVLAESIYHELTSKGYSVFFSKITLESKLGSDYEPIIFAALHSAKVMIHVTTSSENSDSVWVRNEWSRFITLIKSGQKKVLIPAYKGITPYELPNELQNLQGQDFAKIGAMQDLIRGVEKICGKKTASKEKVSVSENDLCEKHLEQGKIYLSKGLWNDAVEEYTSASKLAEHPGKALLGLLLASNKVKTVKSFCSKCISVDLTDNNHYKSLKENVDDSIRDDYELISNVLNDLLNNKVLEEAKDLINEGDWREADKLVKSSKKPEIVDKVKELKYQYILKKKDFDFSIYYIEKLKDLVELAKSIEDYQGVAEWLDYFTKRRDYIVNINESECEHMFVLSCPSSITLPNLYDFGMKLSLVKRKLLAFEFASEELKTRYSNVSEYEKWLIESIKSYLKVHNSRVDVEMIKSIIRNVPINNNELNVIIDVNESQIKHDQRKASGK